MNAMVNDPLFPQQWYIRNTGQSGGTPGIDLNLGDVWADYTGRGVVVGVLDQGIEFNHPDLAHNVLASLSLSIQPTGDGQPERAGEDHGMNVAGEIAAVANNGIGGVGIAPDAKLASVYQFLSFSEAPPVPNDYVKAFEYAAAHYDVFNNSWGGDVTQLDNFNQPENEAAGQALALAASAGRGGLGTVVVFANGNDRLSGANGNAENWDSSPYTIAVAAIDHNGRVSSYSTPGANVLVGAPSGNIIYANVDTDHDGVPDSAEGAGDPVASGGEGGTDPGAGYSLGQQQDPTVTPGSENPTGAVTPGAESPTGAVTGGEVAARAHATVLQEIARVGEMVTTGLVGQGRTETGAPGGDYAFDFSGTSAAAPEVSAVAALMLEANPKLGFRDVQDILALTARNTDKSAQWTINAADNWNGGGMHVNNDVGYGLVDAHAAVRLAETWTSQSTAANVLKVGGSAQVGQAIPEGGSGLSSTITVSNPEVVERAEVVLDMNHAYAADLTITLTSPAGTRSVLLTTPQTIDPSGVQALSSAFPSDPMSMTSTQYLGERSAGSWTLTVQDSAQNGQSGTLNNWQLVLWGKNAATDAFPYVYTNEYSYYAAQNPARTVLNDTSGKTVINASAVTSDSLLNANPGTASTIDKTGLTLSPSTTVKVVYAGDGNDLLYGNGKGDLLNGGRGNDVFYPGPGDNTLDGGPGMNLAIIPTSYMDNNFLRLGNDNAVVTTSGTEVLRNIGMVAFLDAVVPVSSLTFRQDGSHAIPFPTLPGA